MTTIESPPDAVVSLAVLAHLAAGFAGLLAGLVASAARKGGPLHRRAGRLFVVSMLAMAMSACFLAIVIPGQLINVFISLFTGYLIISGWLTARRGEDPAGIPERVCLVAGMVLCAPFLAESLAVAAGLPLPFRSSIPLRGPVLIALYAFSSILVLATVGDIRLVMAGTIRGNRRIARHLWRMCLGLAMALGSGFTNGIARLLPGPYHVPVAFFLPQFLPLLVIAYWLVRLRPGGPAGGKAIIQRAVR